MENASRTVVNHQNERLTIRPNPSPHLMAVMGIRMGRRRTHTHTRSSRPTLPGPAPNFLVPGGKGKFYVRLEKEKRWITICVLLSRNKNHFPFHILHSSLKQKRATRSTHKTPNTNSPRRNVSFGFKGRNRLPLKMLYLFGMENLEKLPKRFEAKIKNTTCQPKKLLNRVVVGHTGGYGACDGSRPFGHRNLIVDFETDPSTTSPKKMWSHRGRRQG